MVAARAPRSQLGGRHTAAPTSGVLTTGAVPRRDEHWGERYRITGQKIFISYGDHDRADNIVQMVLARTPDAPQGGRGISLFLVPKFLSDAAAQPGEHNDLRAARRSSKSQACQTCKAISTRAKFRWRRCSG
jgi:alkylation response protein AidB-like acyl-CoA dehydrogenase